MKILVTGCAGFIGFHLCKRLLQDRSHDVTGIDNLNSYYDVSLKYARLERLGIASDSVPYGVCEKSVYPVNFRFIRLDIEDGKEVENLFAAERFDVVCHLAAQAGVRYSIDNPYQYVSTNIQGFLNIVEACRKYAVGHFVYASSSSVYGKNRDVPYREVDRVDSPVSLYAATKKTGELIAHCYSEIYGLRTTGLRFFTVYGPWGRPDMAPFLFTDAILNDKPVRIFNHGEMFRDFTYIDDIITATYSILLSPASVLKTADTCYRIYNIGNSMPVKIAHFISLLELFTGKEALKEYYPMQAGDVKVTWADVSSLKKDFGYVPSTSLEVGLEKFVNWFIDFYGKGQNRRQLAETDKSLDNVSQ